MHRRNFQQLLQLGSYKENSQLCLLVGFVQDLENQLWDGHPHIYPNLRIFMEEWCDYVIDVGIRLKIVEDKNGKSRRELHQYFDELIRGKRLVRTLSGSKLVVGKNEWSFSLKVRLVECCFSEKGINTKSWAFSSPDNDANLKDQLNKRAHVFTPISDKADVAIGQFEARFGILQIIHDGVYKDFLEKVLKVSVQPYLMPSRAELSDMVEKFYDGQK